MQIPNTQLIYSVFSGTFYRIPNKDIPLISMGHLPLKKEPNSKCKICFRNGFTKRSDKDFSFPPCFCVQKVIDFDILKELEKSYTQLSK